LLDKIGRLVEEERDRGVESNGRLGEVVFPAEETEDVDDGDLTYTSGNIAGGGGDGPNG